MNNPLRIAVLECDTPLDKTKADYGGYGGVFSALLHAAAAALADTGELERHGYQSHRPEDLLRITAYNVVEKMDYPDLDNVDAVLLTGSKYNSFDSDDWILKLVAFTKGILQQQRVRLIGVCFGHQIIGRALDAKVGRSEGGWEVSASKVQATSKGKALFGRDELSMHQMHRDAVLSFPDNVELLGSSPSCENQGMYRQHRFITVQGHPEFNEAIMLELLEKRHEMGIFGDDMYRDGVRRATDQHDGVAVAQAFLRFLLE